MQLRQAFEYKEQLEAVTLTITTRLDSFQIHQDQFVLEMNCNLLMRYLKTLDCEKMDFLNLMQVAKFYYYYAKLCVAYLQEIYSVVKKQMQKKKSTRMSTATALQYFSSAEGVDSGYAATIILCVNECNKLFSVLSTIKTMNEADEIESDKLMLNLLSLTKEADIIFGTLSPLANKAKNKASHIPESKLPLVQFKMGEDESKPVKPKLESDARYKDVYYLCQKSFGHIKDANGVVKNFFSAFDYNDQMRLLTAALIYADENQNKPLMVALSHYRDELKEQIKELQSAQLRKR